MKSRHNFREFVYKTSVISDAAVKGLAVEKRQAVVK